MALARKKGKIPKARRRKELLPELRRRERQGVYYSEYGF